MFNNSRDAFGIAQYLLGINVNTTSQADWEACAEKLKEQKQYIQRYVMDEVFDLMESGEAALAPYYAGDCVSMMPARTRLCLPMTDIRSRTMRLFIQQKKSRLNISITLTRKHWIYRQNYGKMLSFTDY
jgi:spermidine/putrescine-binding protein